MLIKDNGEKKLQQTADQVSGRMDTLYEQIELLTTQVTANQSIQQLLNRLANRETATFQQHVKGASSFISLFLSHPVHAFLIGAGVLSFIIVFAMIPSVLPFFGLWHSLYACLVEDFTVLARALNKRAKIEI
ncbi:hypothetical protein KR50_33640 [Jeotgalibacillus campisalis]|uniref:Uncharacterized protein n=2 Tax=Jeotgalibacillus campisalis TaxID=220754 RepID=A0A0C2VEK8_9BACL|nr:hypothetical protein KR50_33640 [Jeotgalibacillus campisalis]